METRYFIDQYDDTIETDEDTYKDMYNKYELGEGTYVFTEKHSIRENGVNQVCHTIEDYNGYSL